MKFVFCENEHYIDDDKCKECWKDPFNCKNCGGLIHMEFVGELHDDGHIVYACDKCGDKYEF